MMSEVPSITRLTFVFVALLLLTAATISTSFFEIGRWHLSLGLGIGGIKAFLVAYFFMEIWHGDRARPLAVAAGVFWLLILIGLTMADYLTRRWLNF